MTTAQQQQQMRKELEELQRRLEEAESTIAAIRAGEVDAVVVAAERDAVLTLETADRPYRLLVGHKREPALVLTCDGEILACNGHFAHLLEQSPGTLVGSALREHVAADRLPDVEALLQEARRGEVEGAVELRRADGRPVPVYWSLSSVHEGVAGECLLVTDVTERKLYEERRNRSEQFESLVNDAPVGIYLVDADFRIAQINAIAQRLLGNIPGGVVGRDLSQVIHLAGCRERSAEVMEIFRRTLATGEPYETPTPILRAENGTPGGYLEWRVNRITLPDGRFGLVCYLNDVTSHVRTREALQNADRRKDEFLAILAHELRNPLAPIRNALSVLDVVGSKDETAVRARRTLGRQIEQMTRLVDDLVDVNRISRGVVELRKAVVELSSLVHQTIASCRPLTDRAHQEVIVTLPKDPVYLDGDPMRLSQILFNVLHNASKFSPAGARIEVTAERQGDDVVVSIRDSGMGIAPDKLESVFEIFSQVRGPLEEFKGGLGIGLTLVKRLVELHGGTVTARSEGLGKGSEFVVRLPIVTDQAPQPVMRATQRPLPAGPKRRVLVVDDNADNADSLAALLQLSGHETHVALDGEAAIGAAEEYEPDVILLDIGLPKVNGYDVCRRIRGRPAGQRALIFALTGWGQEEDRRKSREAGFDGHFVKPVDHRELLEALTRQK